MPDASEHPDDPDTTTGPGPDGRARLVAALRQPGSRGQVIAAALLAVLGFAAVTQVRSNGRDDAFVGARQGDLIQYINNLSLASTRTQSDIARLDSTRSALGDDNQARRTALELARQRATTLGILAGTLPAEGPGIRVTVRDPATGSGVGTNQMIDGIQELRDAGAEVIELNDKVRVIASTSLEDRAGGGLVVDGTTLRAPFTIDAVGDAQTLATALDFFGGFIDEVHGVGGTVSVAEPGTVVVRSVRIPTKPEYAEPDPAR